MLAYLTDEQRQSCEPTSVDATLATPAIDHRALAQPAYEAALQLDTDRWWVPARLRHEEVRRLGG
ncbi:MAG: hypothetical protein V7607_2504 [Solirubrobacteraceae bacterium]